MAAIAPTSVTERPHAPERSQWLRLLAWASGVVAVNDLIFMGLVGEAIPPLAISVVLIGVGLALLRRAPRTATVVLLASGALMLVMGLPFAAGHLAHPASGIDFVHAAIGIFGRLVAVGVAVATLRRAAGSGARRVAGLSVALLALIVFVATVATLASTGDEAQPGDVITAITEDFEERVEVAAGDTLFVDNRSPFRHTFTVEGAELDMDLPALQGARVAVDLPPGTYDVICAVPGHDFMASTLEVR
jgi:hypothetical protein